MTIQHKDLASGRWQQFSFIEKMANIGSEVERSLTWKKKNNLDYSQKAFERALELITLTLNEKLAFSKLKELARVREFLVDYFFGANEYNSTPEFWHKYFLDFAYAARLKH